MTHAVLTALGLTGQESGTYLGHGEWSKTRDAGVIEPVNPGNGEVLGRVFAFDFALFTLAVSISLWLTGYVTDAFHLDPRTIVLLLAGGSLVPLGMWGAALRWQSRRNSTSR